MAFTKTIVRCAIDINKIDDAFKAITGQNPTIWVNTDVEFQLGFFDGSGDNAALADLTNFDSVSMAFKAFDRSGALISPKTVSSEDINKTLTKQQWSAGTHQHVSISFNYQETAFDMGTELKKNFWLVVYGTTSDVPVGKDVWGGATLTVLQSGLDPDDETLPTQPGNVVPLGAEYDVNGEYVLAVTQDSNYTWQKGANDLTVENDVDSISTSGTAFIAVNASVTLTGTPGAAVTAVVRFDAFLTANQSDARYLWKNIGNACDLIFSGARTIYPEGNESTNLTVKAGEGPSEGAGTAGALILRGGLSQGNGGTAGAVKLFGGESTNGGAGTAGSVFVCGGAAAAPAGDGVEGDTILGSQDGVTPIGKVVLVAPVERIPVLADDDNTYYVRVKIVDGNPILEIDTV